MTYYPKPDKIIHQSKTIDGLNNATLTEVLAAFEQIKQDFPDATMNEVVLEVDSYDCGCYYHCGCKTISMHFGRSIPNESFETELAAWKEQEGIAFDRNQEEREAVKKQNQAIQEGISAKREYKEQSRQERLANRTKDGEWEIIK